ncbi:MAG: DUF4369 domain-containing protein [Bacteroidaceae bacterium]|nr:DUF4369 domain-containing protein [Bacteroidaceae bacterium]
MKFAYLLLFTWFLTVSCNGGYSLKGTTDNFRDGARVFLKTQNADGWVTFDSCDIIHGAFSMQGSADSSFVASLFIDAEAVVPIIIERGDITVDMSVNDVRISGTPLNDRLSLFIDEKNRLEYRMADIERWEASLILEGHTAASAASVVRDSIASVGDAMDAYVENFIKENYNTPLGPCVFRLLCGTLPYPLMTKLIERIFADAPPVFMNDFFVREFVAACEANERILNK